VSNLPVLLYLSVACCGLSVHHKTGYSLYIYLQHSTTYMHSVPRTRLFSPIARTHPPHFFPLHPHAWSSGQSTRGVAEVGRKPRLTSWMASSASSQTDAISIHFPLHLPHSYPQNRKYITYHNNAGGGLSHGHRQHPQKLVKITCDSGDILADRQAHTQTYSSQYFTTALVDEVVKWRFRVNWNEEHFVCFVIMRSFARVKCEVQC